MNTLGTRRSHQYWWSEKSWYAAIWFGCETIMHSGAYQEIIYSAKNESHVASPTLYNKIKTCQAKNSTLLIKSGFFFLALCKYQKHLRDYNSLFTLRLLGNLTQATTSGSKKLKWMPQLQFPKWPLEAASKVDPHGQLQKRNKHVYTIVQKTVLVSIQ